jgi:hypothetical protein
MRTGERKLVERKPFLPKSQQTPRIEIIALELLFCCNGFATKELLGISAECLILYDIVLVYCKLCNRAEHLIFIDKNVQTLYF